MRKIMKFVVMWTIILITSNAFCQNKIAYIKKGFVTEVFSLQLSSTPGAKILNVNVFLEIKDKIPWGEAKSIIEYIYTGIDNQNNLHLQRINHSDKSPVDICTLIFALDSNKSGDITLIGDRLVEPTVFKIHIEGDNNGIAMKYLGNLPKLVE